LLPLGGVACFVIIDATSDFNTFRAFASSFAMAAVSEASFFCFRSARALPSIEKTRGAVWAFPMPHNSVSKNVNAIFALILLFLNDEFAAFPHQVVQLLSLIKIVARLVLGKYFYGRSLPGQFVDEKAIRYAPFGRLNSAIANPS